MNQRGEVEQRTSADRDLHMLQEMILNPAVGNELEYGHVNRIGLYSGTILGRSGDSFREGGPRISVPVH